jgi:hypothetical protein
MSQYNNNNKVSDVLAQMTKTIFSMKGQGQKKRCALAQVTKNKVWDVLAQMTRNNFFL